jgi:hypothetical protein
MRFRDSVPKLCEDNRYYGGFEVFTGVDITPCSPLKVNRSFEGTFFDAEDGGYMFLRNVGRLSTDYTALYPRR